MYAIIDVHLALDTVLGMWARLWNGAALIPLRPIRYAAIVFIGYFLATELSYQFGLSHHIIPLLWPPAGIALAAIVFGGYPMALVVSSAAFAGSVAAHESLGVSISVALGVGVGSAVARVLLEQVKFNHQLVRLQDTLGFVFAAILASLTGSIATSIALYLQHIIAAGVEFDDAWVARAISTALGALVIAPFLIRWLPDPFFRTKRTRAQLADFFGSIAVLSALDYLTYWTRYTSLGPFPTFYLTLIPLMWIALRVGPRGMSLAIFINGTLAVAGIIYQFGGATIDSLLSIQLLLGMLSILFLILVGIEEERKESGKQLEQHILQLEEALERINSEDRAKNEFIAILAHELRNPLSPVLSALEILKFDEPKPSRMHMIESAEGQVKVMRRLLDDLLDIARMTQRKFRLQRESTTLGAAIEQSVRMVEPFMNARNHTFRVSTPKEDLWLFADPARLAQIFSNLLFNAAKYTPPCGEITLSVEYAEEGATIRITDNGIGMKKEVLEQIFEPFIQFRQTKVSAGLGLGLSLTKNLVKMHGGRIHAESPGAGKGSVFTVVLPLSKDTGTLPLPVRTAFPNSKKRRMRILVVDDNAPAALGLGKLLELRGRHRVALAYTGLDALKKARKLKPQVIILDIGLPDMDGYEVARKLRKEEHYAQKLIALTGYGQLEDRQRAREAGFDYHLIKPVGFAEIERVLQRLTLGKDNAAAPLIPSIKMPRN